MLKSFYNGGQKMAKKKKGSLWKEFKSFISRGNVLDMAVGVVIGGAFSAIVNATVKILLSVCTWAVPGGLSGLVTVLPALTDVQRGIPGIGQSFLVSDLPSATIAYAAWQGKVITIDSVDYMQVQSALLSNYTKHGDLYTYNMSAIIDWGTLINAVISFLIIAVVLFTIVKAAAVLKARKEEFEAKAREEYYNKHPEQRPVPVVPGVPAPTEAELLVQIRDLLKEKQ